MGGGGSKPAPIAGPQVIYDPEPVQTPIDGISISSAMECDRCSFQVTPGISTSTVTLNREFGDISRTQCEEYQNDEKKVADKKLTFSDFKARLLAGKYSRFVGDNLQCEEINFKPDDAATITTFEEYQAAKGKLIGTRIRKVSGGSFSADTKVRIVPSIPFKITVGTRTIEPREILVKEMTLYHPSPVRIENVQHDAVLSLNDSSTAQPGDVIVLIPLVSTGIQSASSQFVGKIAGQMGSLLSPDPATGLYTPTSVPTGAEWTLNTLLPTDQETNQVKTGYYVWEGLPPIEQYLAVDTQAMKRYSWRRSTGGSPVYIMLEKPLDIDQSDFGLLLQLPPTPPERAIHGIVGGTLVYKCGSAETGTAVTGTTTKETFKNTCDPFRPNYDKQYGYSPDQMLGVLFNVLTFVAIGVGAWIALTMVGVYRSDTFFTEFATAMGGVIARVFKGAAEKVKATRSAVMMLQGAPSALPPGAASLLAKRS